MRKLIPLALVALTLGACEPSTPEQRQTEALRVQTGEQPVAIASAGGVTLFKVRDNTAGGPSYVYFTAPCGDVNWRQQRDKTSVHVAVPGPTCE